MWSYQSCDALQIRTAQFEEKMVDPGETGVPSHIIKANVPKTPARLIDEFPVFSHSTISISQWRLRVGVYTCFPLPVREEPCSIQEEGVPQAIDADKDLASLPEEELLAAISDKSAEALARILPLLACGEESAAHVFYREGDRLEGVSSECVASQRLIYKIAREEEFHDFLIQRVLKQLPRSEDLETLTERASGFFLRIASLDPATHFFRISQLDSYVCLIMHALLAPTSAVARAPSLRRMAERIRRDESRHVRVSKKHVADLGFPHSKIGEESEMISFRFLKVLELAGDSLEALGTDPAALFLKIKSHGHS
jgi:rubrerythrin